MIFSRHILLPSRDEILGKAYNLSFGLHPIIIEILHDTPCLRTR